MQVDDVMTKKNGNKNEKTTIIITTTILKDQDYNNNRFNPLGLYNLKGFYFRIKF